MSQASGRHDVGDLGEEAAKLADALRQWAGHNIATDSAACRLCPLCQVISTARGLDPELVDRIGHQAQELIRTVTELVETWRAENGGRPREHRSGGFPWE